jgi:hypothetical protein
MPEKPEGTIKYGKFRETGNIGYTRLRKTQYVLDRAGRKAIGPITRIDSSSY